MDICGWIVTYPDGKTCVFNGELRDLSDVQAHIASRGGTYEPIVRQSVANEAIAAASGAFQKACLITE